MTALALATALVNLPPVQASTVKASALARGERRFEAENYLSEGYKLRQRIEGISNARLEDLARVWQPGRLKGIQVSADRGTGFLAATQVFDIRPIPRKWLSPSHTPDVNERFVKRGWVLVTCSGSVGDAILAYRPLDGLIVSHDLLRVVPRNEQDRGYLYAYLRTDYARSMMRSTKYGNVIKHLEPEHLQGIPVAAANASIKATLDSAVERCFTLRNKSYELLLATEAIYADIIGAVDAAAPEVGFPIKARDLFNRSRRLDAHSYNPRAAAVLAAVRKAGLRTERLDSVTDRVWWMTRFKRVPWRPQGVPYLSANQLFSINPAISKRIVLEQVQKAKDFFVKAGWIVMACSGQIYGLNGSVALMTRAHESSFFSHDLVRIIPDTEKIRPGYLFVALEHPTLGRPLVLRVSYGTSVPHLDPVDVSGIPVVRLPPDTENDIADRAERAVTLRGLADDMENAAVAVLEAVIARELGDVSIDTVDAALARLRLIEIEADPNKVLRGEALEKRMARWQS